MMPTDFQLPPGGLGIRNPDPPLDAEKRLHGPKMAAVKAFVRANGFDKMVIDPPQARIGIMTTGKAYLDTRQALEDLGIDEARARALGIRLYKVGMTWPLEPEGARRFAEGLQEVIVVEEKRSNLEDQLVRILYNAPADRRPLVIGKTDETGRIILPSEGELTPTGVAMVIAARLMKHGGELPELHAAAGPPRKPRRSCWPRRRPRWRARRTSARAARTTPRRACRKAAGRWPASAATAWRSGCPSAAPR